MRARILGVESALPDVRVTNADLDRKHPDWDMDQVVKRTGVHERRVCAPDETATDLAQRACERLLDRLAFPRSQVGAMILCTQSPDYIMPPSACLLQHRLALPTTVAAFDYTLACSGFVYGLFLADALVRSGALDNVLLATADSYSRYLHPDDRSTVSLFGDGAAATLICRAGDEQEGIGRFVVGTDGGRAERFMIPAGGARVPRSSEPVEDPRRSPNHVCMDGPGVLAFVRERIPATVRQLLTESGLRDAGHRSGRLPSGERALDRVSPEVARRARREGLSRHRQGRQHRLGVDPDRPARCRARRAPGGGPARDAGQLRCGLVLGRLYPALVSRVTSAVSEPFGDTPCVADLLSRMRGRGSAEAFWWRGESISYQALDERIRAWERRLGERGIGPGVPLALLGDYSPESVSLILALIKIGAIVVPFTAAVASELGELARLAGARSLVRFEADDRHSFESLPEAPLPELVAAFRERRRPGLIVFTSGSTGKPKGILHDCERVIKKFAAQRTAYRTLLFLLMDHFGGFNTFLAALSYGGVLVAPDGRQPAAVARTIERARVELLPVTPTFLNLLLAAGSAAEHDMSSVKLISYGTEVMTEATLKRITELFPNARFQQTYGLSEMGVLRSKSQASGSTWVKVGGEGFETRIVEGILHVRSESAMVGYLNAPDPFDSDGWFNTGDAVERSGEFLRILGRRSEVINVGGQKVFPAEVETALLEAGNVTEATVFGEPHPLMGHVVVARISLSEPEEALALKARLRKHCLARLAPVQGPGEIRRDARRPAQPPLQESPADPRRRRHMTAVRPIRIAEISILQDFLRVHWNANHALVHSASLLTWQHDNPFKSGSQYAKDELSFMGGWDGNRLVAVLGEIPVPFSFEGRSGRGSWLALWKNSSAGSNAGLGLELFHRASVNPRAEFVGGIGVNKQVKPAYRLLRFALHEDLSLHLVLNPAKSSMLVQRKETWSAEAAQAFLPRLAPPARARVVHAPVEREAWEAFWDRQRKQIVGVDRTYDYLAWRYRSHPHYRYEWLQLRDDAGALAAVGVYRIEPLAELGESVVHVVEFLGDPDARAPLAAALVGVMQETGASFVGFRCSHRPALAAWQSAGGVRYGADDPTYQVASLFQPVVPDYRPLIWAYRMNGDAAELPGLDRLYVTRSDGDQDRPSRLPPGRA